MDAIRILEKVGQKPVFRVQDIERLARCDAEYAKQILLRLRKRGLIKQVMRNAYTIKDDIFVVSSNITAPCYISFWSASYFLGYTEQIVNTIQVATTRRMKRLEFGGYKVKFIPMKHFFGYRKMRTDEGDIFIAEDEKLMIDAFLRPAECGNFDEIQKIFESAKFSEGRLADYLKKIGSQAVIKRVGFLLESNRGVDLSDSFDLDRNYVRLNPFSKMWKKRNGKWRVMV